MSDRKVGDRCLICAGGNKAVLVRVVFNHRSDHLVVVKHGKLLFTIEKKHLLLDSVSA